MGVKSSVLQTLLLGWVLLIATACDRSTPTEPESPDPDFGARAEVTVTITITPSDTQLTVGDSTTIAIKVTSDTELSTSEIGVSTDLGNFGTDNSGSDITSTTVTLDDSGNGSLNFFAGDTTGTANILANLGETTASGQITITAEPTLFVTSLDPNSGSPNGGDTVTVTGQGFSTARPMRVTVDGVVASIVDGSISSTSLQFITPQTKDTLEVGEIKVVDVVVTLTGDADNEAQSDTLSGGFTYRFGDSSVGPAILAVSPASGSNLGGDEVTISGTGFQVPVQVIFGTGSSADNFSGAEATVTSVSSSAVVVITPQAPTSLLNSTVNILLRNQSSGLVTVAQSIFTYGEAGLITDIQPREATYTGEFEGESVVISGSGFEDESILTVEFGGQVQSGGTVSDDGTMITFDAVKTVSVTGCNPPSGEVRVTNKVTGEIATSSVTFSYTAEEPSLVNVSPARAEVSSDTSATINGSFSTFEQTTVLFDGRPATITSTATDQLAVTIPEFTGTFDTADCTENGQDGTRQVATAVDVEVLYPATGCTDKLSGGFSYEPTDTSCQVAGTAPVANFSFSVVDLEVNFTDTSTNDPTAWQWSFGDGNTSSEQSPSHTYAAAGTYTVTLKASNSAGSDTATQSVNVGSTVDPPVASFNFSVVDFDVFFTDTSTNDPTSWSWTFGDGSSSSDQNPSHTYAAAGTYTVTLRATNDGGSDTFDQQVTISGPDAPVANFSFSVDDDSKTAFFTDTSSNTPTSWSWNFGDGTSSSEQNPSHTYADFGTYNVTLRATNDGGTDTITQSVTIQAPDPPVAGFNFSVSGMDVTFTNTSTNDPTSFTWFFGDGNSSSLENPTHTYAASGTYTVVLQVSNDGGSDSLSQDVTIP